MTRILKIAHRGASADAPENTLAAFDLAIEQGADHLEFDVRVTGDAHPVLSHGPEVSGPGGRAAIADSTLDHLREVQPNLASLTEVLARYGGRAGLFVELKEVGTADDSLQGVLRILREHGFGRARSDGFKDRLLSFDAELLTKTHTIEPYVGLIQNFHWHYKPTDSNIARANEYATGICVWRMLCSKHVVTSAQEAGLEVYVFTVDRPRTMRRFMARGLDGVLTNHPSRLNALLD